MSGGECISSNVPPPFLELILTCRAVMQAVLNQTKLALNSDESVPQFRERERMHSSRLRKILFIDEHIHWTGTRSPSKRQVSVFFSCIFFSGLITSPDGK